MNLCVEESVCADRETTLKVTGEIDVYTAPQLKEKLLASCSQEEWKVVVDLSGVTYMDSTGLGVFIGAYKTCQSVGGSLHLVGLTPRVARLFNITGVDELITIENVLMQGDGQ